MVVSTSQLQASSVLGELARCGVTHVVWLPDSETGFLYQAISQSALTLVPVCREGESIAIAAGLIMGGKRPVVLIQSTGFFESGDSVRGLALDLHLPLVLILGYRGYPGEGRSASDSAARFLEPILSAWGIPYAVVTSDATCPLISASYERAQREQRPMAILVGREYDV